MGKRIGMGRTGYKAIQGVGMGSGGYIMMLP